jgi:chaperonin GroEL
VLAQAIVRQGMQNVAAGADPLQVRRSIERAVDEVVDYIRSIATEVSGRTRSRVWRRSRPATRRSAT